MDEEDEKNLNEQPQEEEGVAQATDLPGETDAEGEAVVTADESSEGGARQEVVSIVKELKPDVDETNEAALFEAILYVLSRYKSFGDRFKEVFRLYPEFAEAVDGILNKMPPHAAIKKFMDIDSLTPPDGAEDYESYETAMKEREDMIRQKEERVSTIQKNVEISQQNAASFAEKYGYDPDKAESTIEWIEKLFKDYEDGMVEMENFNIAYKGLNYDSMADEKAQEAEKLYEDGVVSGKNAQISKKRQMQDKGDGLPKLSTSGAASTGEKKKRSYGEKFFDGVL